MRKVIFLLFCGGVFFINSLFSQENSNKFFDRRERIMKDQGAIYLKSRLVNFSKEDFVTEFQNQKKHIYLKFKNSPNKLMINKLKKQGISLKDYLSDGTYMVEINQDKLNFLKEMYFIGGFAEIDPADKLSEKLYKKEISSYAREGNYVKVIVAFYEDVLFNDAVSQIRTVGGNVESKNFSRTHKINR